MEDKVPKSQLTTLNEPQPIVQWRIHVFYIFQIQQQQVQGQQAMEKFSTSNIKTFWTKFAKKLFSEGFTKMNCSDVPKVHI